MTEETGRARILASDAAVSHRPALHRVAPLRICLDREPERGSVILSMSELRGVADGCGHLVPCEPAAGHRPAPRRLFGHSSFVISYLLPFLLLAVGLFPAHSAPLSSPAVDSYDVRVGTETFAGLYKFTTNTLLVETAQAMTNMGSDVIKFYMGANAAGQSGVTLTQNITNLLTLARDQPSYHQVLDMPFRHFIIWEYPFENSDEWWGSGYNSTQGAKDYNEMYALTAYLLTNYDNSGKTFYLGHWEGDGYLDVSNWTANPSPVTVQGMIGWLNNRQKAVDDARSATPHTNVFVYNYAEANRVRDAMSGNSNINVRVIDSVVPFVTNLDYLSYSSYDAQNLSTSNLYATLDYMQSMLPTNKASMVPGERIWIGEYGWGYLSLAAQEPLTRPYIQRLLSWNSNGHCLPYILFWEMYDNQGPATGATNFCLIDPTDTKAPCYYLHQYFLNQAKMLTARYLESNGALPTETQFSSLVSPILNAPLSAPVNLTVANLGAALSTNATTSVSGQITQGVYGDDEASVWVFWGPQDGGTVRANWQQSLLVGVNTNFNPATFDAQLTHLLAQTNYFFRFWASNASSQAWAPASSQFSTVTIDPATFGSQLKISFAGYNRSSALTNFPVLVSLGTNLPGFSYRQFGSPSGGDLRFADVTGIVPLPYEIDEWNTNGTSYVWVQVPVLAGPTNFVWAYWGNPAATNPAATSTNGAVWSPLFELVWHLKESGFPFADSAQMHPALAGVSPVSTAGVIGKGVAFNGSSQFLDAGTFDVGNTFTLSAWVNIAAIAGNIQSLWTDQKGGYGSAGFALFVDTYNVSNKVVDFASGDGSNGNESTTATNSVSFGHWHLVTAAINRTAGTVEFYVDGTDLGGSTAVVTDFATLADVNLGRFTNSSFYFDGAMDEARVQSGVASADWVWASWMTVASNSVLLTYAAVTQQPPSLSITASANGLQGSWPASGVGYQLYITSNLVPPVAWVATTNQPMLSNNEWQIALPVNGNGPLFYRLQSQ